MPIPIAVLFSRFGPYHLARLKAASREARIFALELTGKDKTYAWAKVEGADGFERETLFPDLTQNQPASETIRREVYARCEARQPRAVFISGWHHPFSLSALLWCRERGVPAVLMSESQAIDESRRGWKEALKRRIVGCFAAGLVGGVRHAEYLVALGMPRDRIFQGYDAVDNQYFAEKAFETRKQKAENGKPPGLPERYFLASARFVEKKNLLRLIQAYAMYRAQGARRKAQGVGREAQGAKREAEGGERDAEGAERFAPCAMRFAPRASRLAPWDLVLLGDGPLRGALEAQINACGVQNHVLMPGFKQYDELPAYYGRAGAFIHASTTEQWGLVVNEAMASGLPVLVSHRCGCAPELVREGENGFGFDPLNVEELAHRMSLVASMDQSQRQALGARSQEIIAGWGPERFASGFCQAVETALRVPPRRASLFDGLVLRGLLRR